jgi:hypothetical protein
MTGVGSTQKQAQKVTILALPEDGLFMETQNG